MILAVADKASLYVVIGYLVVLLGIGVWSRARSLGTSGDFFLASRALGPVLLLLSVFGTTMTAFALVGSTGQAYQQGIGVYGLMASSSGLVHSLVFFVIGVPLWAIGKRHGFVTQIQFFRARLDSGGFGYLLFPILIALVLPYVLIGILGAGAVVRGVTVDMFPATFPGVPDPISGRLLFVGAVPAWLTGGVVSLVVLFYIFLGGLRGAVWANALQTVVFMSSGVAAFWLIAGKLGGVGAATRAVTERAPQLLAREGLIGHGEFVSYLLVPLSVGMFPHVFQHWLTAKSAKTFRLTIVAHPLFILIVWLPCILLGIWAAGQGMQAPGGNVNAVLPMMVGELLHDPLLSGLLTAGILAAIMSSLDSQFVCLGAMFTHDIVVHAAGRQRFADRQLVLMGRAFIVLVVAVAYLLSLRSPPSIFVLAVWCFSGFTGLIPLVFAAIYWRRLTKVGAIASVLTVLVSWSWLFHRGMLAPLWRGEHPGEGYLIGGVMPVAIIFALSAVALVVGSWVSKPPPDRVVDAFIVPASRSQIS